MQQQVNLFKAQFPDAKKVRIPFTLVLIVALILGAGGIGMGLLFLLVNRYNYRNIFVKDLSELKMEMAKESDERR